MKNDIPLKRNFFIACCINLRGLSIKRLARLSFPEQFKYNLKIEYAVTSIVFTYTLRPILQTSRKSMLIKQYEKPKNRTFKSLR